MAKRKPAEMAQMNLRLRESLRRKIENEAKRNGWSMNRELVLRIEASFNLALVEAMIARVVRCVLEEQHATPQAHSGG